MIKPTGSALERASKCAASFVLPQAPHTGEAAERGNANHEAIEKAMVAGDLSGLPRVVRELLEGATKVWTEVAFAIDVESETVRLLGERIGRDYGRLTDTEISLTVDAIIEREGELLVVDWKSRQRVSPAKHNLQLHAACVAVMGWRKQTDVLGAIAYLDDGEVDSAAFGAFDAAVWFDEARKMLTKIRAAQAIVDRGEVPAVHAGSWCQYCPSMPYCPAQTRQALVLIGELESIEQKVAFMSAAQVGEAWQIKKSIEKLLERVDASLRLRVQSDVIPLANGKRLAFVEKSRESFDKEKALARIKELGGSVDGLTKRTTYTQISEVKVPPSPDEVARLREALEAPVQSEPDVVAELKASVEVISRDLSDLKEQMLEVKGAES